MAKLATKMRPHSFKIAPEKWNHEWQAISRPLVAGADAAVWKEVLRAFYRGRLQSRYLDAIAAIRKSGGSKGEGFAIVAIQCSLIEFLESCYQGINYRHKKPTPPHQYRDSRKIFVSFLSKRPPFKARFTPALASEFYSAVRCGVLHEARTKGGWRIRDRSGSAKIIDAKSEIFYRDDFQDALEKFIEDYCTQVAQRPKLQKAFIRKYDDLCF